MVGGACEDANTLQTVLEREGCVTAGDQRFTSAMAIDASEKPRATRYITLTV